MSINGLIEIGQLAKRPTGFSQQLSSATEVVLEVKSGEGGDDAKLFVHDLFAALSRHAQRCGLDIEVLSDQLGHVTAKIMGAGVWQTFGKQIGIHCVQRIPPTENRGRRHTSYVAVSVMPIVEVDLCALNPNDVEVKTQGGHGPGGQHQNKTDSAVRMTHKPTGIQVFINGRSQRQNKIEALRVLTARVRDHERQEADQTYRSIRQQQLGQTGRGKKIRTYNFINDRAVDHRTGAKSSIRQVLEKGRFEMLD